MYSFFALGREPQLSIAEIQSLYEAEIISVPFSSQRILIAEMKNFEAQKAAARLGGSIKYGFVERFEDLDRAKLLELIANRVLTHGQDSASKILFSVDGYDNIEGKKLGFEVKSLLTREGRKVRLVTSKEETMSAAALEKSGVLKKGIAFIVVQDGRTTWLGKIEAVQPFEEQAIRDYERPARDALRGMIPVQLARTLINIGLGQLAPKKPEEITFLDPFCGLGTTLMEASLLGVKQVIGADIDEKAIHETENNIAWLKKSHPKMASPELLVRDARETSMTPRIDLVVTEPYLGEPVRGVLTKDEIDVRLKSLSTLYAASIRALANTLKPGGILIMTLPAYKLGLKYLEFPKTGLLPKTLTQISAPQFGDSPHAGTVPKLAVTEPLIYKRADQYVGREIFIAKKS